MIALEALELALSKEKAAIELYQRLSIAHPEIRELFTFLVGEEQKHRKMIEEKMAEFLRF